MEKVQTLFDKPVTPRQRQTPAAKHPLYQEAQARLNERLEDVKQPFTCTGKWRDGNQQKLRHCEEPEGRRGNPSPQIATEDKDQNCVLDRHGPIGPRDDNGELVFYNLITSCLTLQSAANLQNELAAIYASLAQGGLFLGVLAGGQTLYELRTCLMEAEVALSGGASPRVHPLPDPETMSRLLLTTGFALPVVDQERVTLTYPDLFALMRDLRAHGQTNNLAERSRRFAPRALFTHAQDIYGARFPAPHGGIAVTVDLVFLHGWKE